jgi:pyridinium-3,5-bisthiocarboxylic acid mononucleotide nickel chelatase
MVQNIAYIDCSAGVSPELLLGAALDAGLALESLQEMLCTVSIFAACSVECTAIRSPERTGSQVILHGPDEPVLLSFAEWSAALEQVTTLPVSVVQTMLAILQTLAEATLVLSGLPRLRIAFSLSDVFAMSSTVLAFHMLTVQHIYATPLPLLIGQCTTASGETAPALDPLVLEVARRANIPWQPAQLPTVPLTSPGVAILAHLAEWSEPAMVMERIGYGLHGEPLQTSSAALRLYIGREPSTEAVGGMESDWVAVIESHIDNMSGELLGGLMERLFVAGALDATFTPIQMKKNRPATLVTVICPLELDETFALLLVRETSTLGVRIQHVRRLKAQREQVCIGTALGSVLVKVKGLGGEIVHVSPEFEECQRIAREQGLPLMEVYDVVRDAIRSTIVIEYEKKSEQTDE